MTLQWENFSHDTNNTYVRYGWAKEMIKTFLIWITWLEWQETRDLIKIFEAQWHDVLLQHVKKEYATYQGRTCHFRDLIEHIKQGENLLDAIQSVLNNGGDRREAIEQEIKRQKRVIDKLLEPLRVLG